MRSYAVALAKVELDLLHILRCRRTPADRPITLRSGILVESTQHKLCDASGANLSVIIVHTRRTICFSLNASLARNSGLSTRDNIFWSSSYHLVCCPALLSITILIDTLRSRVLFSGNFCLGIKESVPRRSCSREKKTFHLSNGNNRCLWACFRGHCFIICWSRGGSDSVSRPFTALPTPGKRNDSTENRCMVKRQGAWVLCRFLSPLVPHHTPAARGRQPMRGREVRWRLRANSGLAIILAYR